jgi:hypothetical protein
LPHLHQNGHADERPNVLPAEFDRAPRIAGVSYCRILVMA